MLITILATILVLGVLIFVHELGHFVTAKLADIEVPRFSIGFGPKVWGFRRGETEYVISALPLGGYVRMAGMEELERMEGGPDVGRADGDDEDDDGAGVPTSDMGLVNEEPTERGPRDFESKSVPVRAVVLSAGVIMNLLFAFFAFTGIAWVWGIPFVADARIAEVTETALPAGTEPLADVPFGARVVAIGDEQIEDWKDVQNALLLAPPGPLAVRFADAEPIVIDVPDDQEARVKLVSALMPVINTEIGEVAESSPAAAAGLQPGDEIVAVAGTPTRTRPTLVRLISENAGEPIQVRVARDGREVTMTLVPDSVEVTGPEGEQIVIGRIGVYFPAAEVGLTGAVVHGAATTWRWISMVVEFLVELITGETSPRNLGGPILIGQVSGQVARAGMEPLLRFMAVLSVNLAILNLLPIPLLDGGQLLFLGIEGVRGRALSLESRMRLSQVGFIIVVAIMVWAIANDVLRLFGI